MLGGDPVGRVAVAAAGAAVALGTFRVAGDAPKPLLLTLGAVFAVVALAALAARRTPGPGLVLLLWAALSAAFLGALHRADRAGWNWTLATGLETAIEEDLRDRVALGAAELVRRDARFAPDPRRPGGVVLRRGVYDVSETLVIPAGVPLAIEPGTVLRFSAGRSLVAYGPIQARGTKADPIVFTARHPWLKWGVVAVVGGSPSRFEHVRVEHARWARVNGLDLPGALTFLESDVELSRSEVANAFGKDAVYVRGGRIVARGNVFRAAVRDGLDVDGGSGIVAGNRFLDCGDEAIDLSGRYRIEIVDNEIRDARGGRVAAGADLDTIRSRNTFGRPDAGGHPG